MFMKSVTLAVLACLLSGLDAQVQVKGRFQETVMALQKSANMAHSPLYQPVEKVSNFKLQTEEMFNDAMVTKPYKFAESLDMPLDISKDGSWQETRALDGTPIKIWRAIVASDEALSLSLQFDEFKLPQGAEFYIIGRESMMGAFTAQINNKNDGSFATVPVPGDFLGLEIVMPMDKNKETMEKMLKEEMRFKIGKIAHGFRPFPKSFNDSGSCNIDVACETNPAYANQIKSVGMIITRDGTRFCTGTMINNTRLNRRQLFLTANHCLFTSAYNFVAVFNYQHSTCDGSGPEPSLVQSAHGMRLISTYAPSDFALLEITEAIPDSYNVYLAGWDISSVAPSNVFGVHHPSGDVKKISFYNGTTIASSWTEYPKKLHWSVPAWTRGTTEPGSSGSALFNSRGLVVGHLHGGQASCSNPTGYDMYGGMVHDWNGGGFASRRLRDHLNPAGLAVTSLQGMPLRRTAAKIEMPSAKKEDGLIDDIFDWFGNVFGDSSQNQVSGGDLADVLDAVNLEGIVEHIESIANFVDENADQIQSIAQNIQRLAGRSSLFDEAVEQLEQVEEVVDLAGDIGGRFDSVLDAATHVEAGANLVGDIVGDLQSILGQVNASQSEDILDQIDELNDLIGQAEIIAGQAEQVNEVLGQAEAAVGQVDTILAPAEAVVEQADIPVIGDIFGGRLPRKAVLDTIESY